MNGSFSRLLIVGQAVASLILYGCAPATDSPTINDRAAGTHLNSHSGERTEPVATIVDARPAALINGKALTWGELRPTLTELAGADALQEMVLDRRLNESLITANITITAADAIGERKLILESLHDDPNQAIRLLDELRQRQKLGSVRFEALLHRNAGLRALVKDQVAINEDGIRNMHEFLHGAKRQARLITVESLESALAAINLIRSGGSFADVAVEASTDSSAPRGGLLEPISRVDPDYPESVRQTLWTLEPGEVSGPVIIDDGFAVLMLVKRVAGDGVQMEEARPQLERLLRLQQERLFMDQLARRLLVETQVTIFDDTLHESWSKGRR